MWDLHTSGVCERCGQQAAARPSRVCDDCRMLSAVIARTHPNLANTLSPYRELRAWAEAEIGDAVLRHCRLLVTDPEGAMTPAERKALRKQRDKVLRLLRREVPTNGV